MQTGRHDTLIVQSQNPETQILTMNSLEACLKEQLIPQGWSWVKKEKILIFTFHDRGTFDARIRVEIVEDLSAEVRNIV